MKTRHSLIYYVYDKNEYALGSYEVYRFNRNLVKIFFVKRITIMQQLKRILTILLLMFTCGTYAQVIYPSNVTTTLTPPYSIYLDEYSNPLTPKIKANIVFTDFTEASWEVSQSHIENIV